MFVLLNRPVYQFTVM